MHKILSFCDKIGLLRPIFRGRSLDYLTFGPTGELLVNNLKEEWIHSCVLNSSGNVFPFYRGPAASPIILDGVKDSFVLVKNLCQEQLPFSLAEIRHQSEQIGAVMGIADTGAEPSIFNPSKGTVLRLLQFVSPLEANRFFTNLQRERKIWWRKFSSSPGRFKLTEVTKQEGNAEVKDSGNHSFQSVHIISEFEWGKGVVETLRLYPSSCFISSENHFQLREGQLSVLPCALESVLTLDVAALVYLCDAFDDKTESNIIMRLHRRIAPFKVSFASSASGLLLEKAYALAEHLTALLRRAGHSTLLLRGLGKSVQSALVHHNEIGIPFTVVISDSTLSDGIAHLYSRETSLQEQVHISQLVNYMNQLLHLS